MRNVIKKEKTCKYNEYISVFAALKDILNYKRNNERKYSNDRTIKDDY